MLKHSLIGFGISLACLLPPVVHFVTGPLGPFIGGWFAGSRLSASSGQAIGIGALMGLFTTFPIGAVLVIGSIKQSLIPWIGSSLLLPIGIAMLGYTSLLGSLGAALGGYMVSRSSRRTEVSNK